jgi:hypothetical protein
MVVVEHDGIHIVGWMCGGIWATTRAQTQKRLRGKSSSVLPAFLQRLSRSRVVPLARVMREFLASQSMEPDFMQAQHNAAKLYACKNHETTFSPKCKYRGKWLG